MQMALRAVAFLVEQIVILKMAIALGPAPKVIGEETLTVFVKNANYHARVALVQGLFPAVHAKRLFF